MLYEKHIFVCENIREAGAKKPSCGNQGSSQLRQQLKEAVKKAYPDRKIRVNMSGCLDRCEEGPSQVCYPEGGWFCLKTESDVQEFVNTYLAGKPAPDRLRLP